jgi:8-oxo-dGTP pyrophosphatase MutT (NUDIX family)
MRDARLVETEILLPKPKRFVREALVMPDGYELDWYYVGTSASVMVVPVTSDGDLVFVRQHRHSLKAYAIEFPAGTADEDEDLAVAAPHELEEETGFTLAPSAELRRSALTTRCRPRRTTTRTSSSRSPSSLTDRLAVTLRSRSTST